MANELEKVIEQMVNPFEEIIKRLDRIEKYLMQIRISDVVEQATDVQGAADFIGLDNVQTIYRMVREGRIPHYKKGSRLFFYKSELNQWIKGELKSEQENQNNTI